MNKLILIPLFTALAWSATAQVGKQVEVTKAYVPNVSDATKLAVEPDMTDTTRMRPEIDYTITPLTLRTALATRQFRPATVTYWEFNRPKPFYIKAGAGYPTNTVLDVYASTQNPSTGYLTGYLNHEGRFAQIRNDFGIKNNSTQMVNRAGFAAGKYFGRHTLEGDFSYDNRLYHRYGSHYLDAQSLSQVPALGDRVDFGEAHAALRIGDDFKDLSRLNFEVSARGDFFFDHSQMEEYEGARQTTLDVQGRLARAFGRHRIEIAAGYERLQGAKATADYLQQMIRAGVRYGVHGDVVRMDVGADYVHDGIQGVEAQNYLLPYLHLDVNLGTQGLRPFAELDGEVRENSYRTLSQLNPYVVPATTLDRSTVAYNIRFGVGGSLWENRFNYRLYAGFSIRENQVYWYSIRNVYGQGANEAEPEPVSFLAERARQTVTSFNGEAEYRPLSSLLVTLGVHGYIYNDSSSLGNGSPVFEGNLGVKYDGRKFAFGVEGLLQSTRKWTTVYNRWASIVTNEMQTFEAPLAVDLRLHFDWKVSAHMALFVEGRNLANARLYRYAWMPEYGAAFTVGVKAHF